MNRSLFYATAVACAATASMSWADTPSEAPDHHALTPEIIEGLESRIVMPDPWRPLTSYVRYYTLATLEDGSPYIYGAFFATKPGEGYWSRRAGQSAFGVVRWRVCSPFVWGALHNHGD